MYNFKTISKFAVFILLFGCAANNEPSGQNGSNNIIQSYAANPANIRVSLTDAPAKDLTNVFVNVHHAELWVKNAGKEGRILLAQNLGAVDLMTLRNGVTLSLQDFTLPEGTEIHQVRLVLDGTGNYSVKENESRCDMQTPSGQQSGIKIIFKEPVAVMGGYSYSLVVDFDAEKSVVIQGNGDCLLKPVLKIAGFTKVPTDSVDEGGGTAEEPGDDVTDGETNDNSGDSGENGSGYDDSDPNGWPPGYDPGTF